jgi:hypothetical protein
MTSLHDSRSTVDPPENIEEKQVISERPSIRDPSGYLHDDILNQNKEHDHMIEVLSNTENSVNSTGELSGLTTKNSFVINPRRNSKASTHQVTIKSNFNRQQTEDIRLNDFDLENSHWKLRFEQGGYVFRKRKQTLCEKIQNPSQLQIFCFCAIVIPMMLCLWYAAAIVFPPGANERFSFFLWTNGELKKDDQGQPFICPRASICSEGVFQIILIAFARLSAFASYVVMALTFLSKMHSLIHFLSTTYISTLIPFESLHEVHKLTGKMFGFLALIHTITHYLRYIVRKDSQQLGTQVHISGLVAITAMTIVVLSMSVEGIKKRIAFEKRFNAHWLFVLVILALLFHTERTRKIVLVFFILWAIDYTYAVIRRSHRLGVVEFTHIGDDAGTQMLWRNPEGFNPKSGEYVYVKLPWLKEGGDEWHPFSIYLREATEEGLHGVHQDSVSSPNDPETPDGESLFSFAARVMQKDFSTDKDSPSSLLLHEARQNLKRFDTTQVFISPIGNWSKGLLDQVRERKQLQSCWIRGPFTSPYFVAHDFSHLILTASGIGITPALGVMGQYPGFSRTKIFIWSTRSKTMLKFFAPLLKDAHLSVVFYTGKEDLSQNELNQIQAHGNIFVQKGRPESMTATIGSLITMFENNLGDEPIARNIMDLDQLHRQAWCVLYCGGSTELRDKLQKYTVEKGLGWECELFDW